MSWLGKLFGKKQKDKQEEKQEKPNRDKEYFWRYEVPAINEHSLWINLFILKEKHNETTEIDRKINRLYLDRAVQLKKLCKDPNVKSDEIEQFEHNFRMQVCALESSR